VADYCAVLLGELRRHGPVASLGNSGAPERSGVALYHLGNNGLHAAIYRRALERPGVIVLHDAVLHHFLLGQLDEEEYVDEFAYNYGAWHRPLARELWRARAPTGADTRYLEYTPPPPRPPPGAGAGGPPPPTSGSDPRYFEYPMLKRVVERSLAVVVHNPAARALVLRHVPAARVTEIPHLFSPPELPALADALRWRQTLGIGPVYLYGVFGYLRESKRLMQVLGVFARLHRELPQTALLVAGQFASRDLERAARPLLTAPGVLRRPYLEEREFWLAARAVDACINLRYPTAGETSGISIRLMGLGKPVLVTEGAETARFPEDACIRIPAGLAEPDSLYHHLILLPSFPTVAASLGERAAASIAAGHGIQQVGEEYWNLLGEYSA
jgi:glycosyltransferase involved in cell wall biosynthesis